MRLYAYNSHFSSLLVKNEREVLYNPTNRLFKTWSLREAIKQTKNSQTWDIVPSSLPPTPPYWSWDAYETHFQMTKYPPIIHVIK